MGFSGSVASLVLLFHAIVFLQSFCAANSREMNKGSYDQNNKIQVEEEEDGMAKLKENLVKHHSSYSTIDPNDPEFQVFFRVNELKLGGEIPMYFPIRDSWSSPPLLSRKEVETIPFSSDQLPKILDLFSIPDGSPQAKAMETTLMQCEFEPMRGESKFCATSRESLLDSIRAIFGPNNTSYLKVLTTKHLTNTKKTWASLLQNYTVAENPKQISAPKIVGCHPLPYPYSVFYCHNQESDKKLLKVSLVGENGWRVEAIGICHLDTSQWDPRHIAFLVLKILPGKSPVCHFFPADNLVWLPAQYEFM